MAYTLQMVSNARWANAGQTLVDCTLDHPTLGSIPYACGADPQDADTQALWDLIVADQAGAQTLSIAAFQAPTNAQIAAKIELSRIKFLGALATALSQPPETIATFIKTAITTAEGLAQISAGDAALARFFIDNANTFHRVDPNPAEAALLVAVGAILGLDEDAIDSLFIAAASA